MEEHGRNIFIPFRPRARAASSQLRLSCPLLPYPPPRPQALGEFIFYRIESICRTPIGVSALCDRLSRVRFYDLFVVRDCLIDLLDLIDRISVRDVGLPLSHAPFRAREFAAVGI